MAKPQQSNILSVSNTPGQILTSSDTGQPIWTAVSEPIIVRYTEKDLARLLRANDGDVRIGVMKAYVGLLRQMIPSICKNYLPNVEDREHKDLEHFAAVLAASWGRTLTALLDVRVYGDGTFELLTKVS